jgi:hypothetical protein
LTSCGSSPAAPCASRSRAPSPARRRCSPYVVTQVAADWTWLAPLSAWHYFETTALIDEGTIPGTGFAVFAAVAICGWLGALWAFRRRDLAA